MRVFGVLFLISVFSGCTAGEQMRTGVVGSDGRTVYWNQPEPNTRSQAAGRVVQTLLQAGSAYCTGYANARNSQPHGQAMVITPGGQNSFIYW